ncbi:hypothetical protein BYT27DRAFT_7228035 [Phlegmacium glaucopus]|nr:hypothetical protein BYT27DRAFT_7228035 [Phlegmacium glaucopus]
MNIRWREYARLPTSDTKLPLNAKTPENNTHSILGLRMIVPKRYSRLLLALVVALGIFYFFHAGLLPHRYNPQVQPYPQVLQNAPDKSGLPPLFEAYTEYENHLPQQLDDNIAERKYIFVANHAHGCGWGNALQEMVFSTLVASGSGRGFVWHDYAWNRDGPKYSEYNGKKIPSRIPISTMLSGYILGLNSGNKASNETRPISRFLYENICPPEKRVYIDRSSVEALRQLNPANAGTSLDTISGKAILDAWLDRLNQSDVKDARCVEVTKDTLQIVDFWVLGSNRVHDLWDTLANSPIMNGWSWSPLIYQAFKRNRDIISPKVKYFLDLAASDETDSLPLLTLHLRRGDYADHCVNLAGWGSTYTGQSSFPEFAERDSFIIPKVVEGYSSNVTTPGDTHVVSSEEEKTKYYLKHCYPDVGQVVNRVREVVHDYEAFLQNRSGRLNWGSHKYENWGSKTWQKRWGGTGRESIGNKRLKRVFIMTNGDKALLQELKQALMDDAERSKMPSDETNGWDFEWTWEGVSTSRDLDLGWEEKPVGQALDMYTAQRSELFVGNGFSSLTANIVVLRMKDGRNPLQIRFW